MKRLGKIVLIFFLIPLSLNFSSSALAAPGDTDYSYSLDGATTTSQMADSNSLDIRDGITIEAWVKPTGHTSGVSYQVLNKEGTYELYTASGSWIYALNGTGGWAGVNTGIAVRNDEWQHVAFTRASGADTVNFYFNGSLAFTGNADGVGTGQISNTTYPLQIGSRSASLGSAFSSYFKGQIDEVRLYHSDRTAAQIQTDMHSYGPVNSAGLVLYLDFNEGTSSTYTNRSTDSTAAGNLTSIGTNSTSLVATSSTVGSDTVVTFTRDYLTTNGGWIAPTGTSNARALVVGGGGGGGAAQYSYSAGGGGGGQVNEANVALTDRSVYPIRVGGGGLGGTRKAQPGFLGDTSTAFSLVSAGGGGGASGQKSSDGTASLATLGYTGGGGGAYWNVATTVSTGAGSGARKGGDARTDGAVVNGQAGGGGAGAGGAGGDVTTTGTSPSIVATGGSGGSGVSSTLQTNSTVTYGGGGGGGKRGGTASTYGVGIDGGGNGGLNAVGTDGSANRGGGGGGAGVDGGADSDIRQGGKGGNGIVILRYAINLTSSTTISMASGDLIYRTAKTLAAISNKAGKMDFKVNGKYIPGCRSMPVSVANSYTATCSYKPSIHGSVTITAIFTPNDGSYSSSSAVNVPVQAARRTNRR